VVTPGRVDYGVGGAVVALSDPDGEYEETAVKATPLLGLFQAEFPDRVS
jgi:para-aminobenzoate synthetase